MRRYAFTQDDRRYMLNKEAKPVHFPFQVLLFYLKPFHPFINFIEGSIYWIDGEKAMFDHL